MKHVSVLVPAGSAVLSSIIGSYKLFSKINEYMLQSGQMDTPPYKVELVGIKPHTELYDGAFIVKPHKQISEIEKTDLIIVTTIVGDMPTELQRNAEFVPWGLKK